MMRPDSTELKPTNYQTLWPTDNSQQSDFQSDQTAECRLQFSSINTAKFVIHNDGKYTMPAYVCDLMARILEDGTGDDIGRVDTWKRGHDVAFS